MKFNAKYKSSNKTANRWVWIIYSEFFLLIWLFHSSSSFWLIFHSKHFTCKMYGMMHCYQLLRPSTMKWASQPASQPSNVPWAHMVGACVCVFEYRKWYMLDCKTNKHHVSSAAAASWWSVAVPVGWSGRLQPLLFISFIFFWFISPSLPHSTVIAIPSHVMLDPLIHHNHHSIHLFLLHFEGKILRVNQMKYF